MTLINYFFILMFFRVLEFISAVEPSHLTPAPALDFFFLAPGKKVWLRLLPENLSSSRLRLRKTDCKNLFRRCPDFDTKHLKTQNFNKKPQ